MSGRTIDARQSDAARTWRAEGGAGRQPIALQQVGVLTVSERMGEGRLMLAVLEDAIASFWRYYRARAGRSRRLFHRERAWFATDDVGEPFAFATICDTLGLDRAWLRRMLPIGEVRPAAPAAPPGDAEGAIESVRAIGRELSIGCCEGAEHVCRPMEPTPSTR